ncbi:ATP-binding cassette domain-containing protein, partial [bacterium]|nr:ATP-binding cassette domain-containing protein [bacterium]
MAEFITLNQISKNIGARELLKDVSIALSTEQKIGVIGRNGCGKTTLFRIILGEEEA